MTKKRQDYTKFMKSPTPLRLSPPSDGDDGFRSRATEVPKQHVPEENIPWGEVIVEPPKEKAAVQLPLEAPGDSVRIAKGGIDESVAGDRPLPPGTGATRGPRPEDIEYLEKLPYPSLPATSSGGLFASMDAPPFGAFLIALVLLLLFCVAGIDNGP